MIDLIPYVNSELAALKIGAHPLTFLEKGKNPVRCDDKKFKGSVVVYLNESNGKITNFSIHCPKLGGVKSRTVKIRDILEQGYEPREVSRQEIESLRVASERRKIDKKLACERSRKIAIDSYHRADESGTSAYFLRKQVKPSTGVRFDGATAIIPVCTFKHGNKLKHVANQRIDENGQKLFNKNAEISGGFFPIGNRLNPHQIYFCEGVATGLSIHQSLDNPNDLVIACFDSGNLKKVVAEFASHYQMVYAHHGFTLCADNDQWIENPRNRFAGFKAIDAIIDQFPNCLISYPDFDKSIADLYAKHGVANPTDFNDFMILNGSPAVQWSILRQAMTANEFKQLYDFKSNSLVDDDAQREFLARISEAHKNRQLSRDMAELLRTDIVLPAVQIPRDERDAARDAEIERIRTEKLAIDEQVKQACAISDEQGGAKKAQSKRRAEIRSNGNAKKREIELSKKPVEKYRLNDTPIDADKNAIACYFKPFRDVELGIANGKFSQITSKYVDIPLIKNGATELLYCGMGSGKTRNFIGQAIDLVKEILHTENRIAKILVLSPRVALVNKLVLDLNTELAQFKKERDLIREKLTQQTHGYIESEFLEFYSYDVLKSGMIDGQKIKANLLVSTVHSAKFFDTDDFDLVIADEFHQIRHCFLQSMENAVANFDSLNSTIKTARRFIATGADLTQKDIDFIENLRGTSHVWYQLPDKNDKNLTLRADKKNLDRAGYEAIRHGEWLIIPCNSKAYIRSRAKLLDKLGISNLAIYDDVTGEKNVSQFLDDPNGEIDKYQVILYSPVITSGLSFDALPNRHDRLVFGYFTSYVGAAGDAHQMLGRYRGNSTKYQICLDAPTIDAGANALQKAQTQLKRLMQQAKNDPYKFKSLLANNPIQKREYLTGLIESDNFDNVFSDFDRFIFSLNDETVEAQRDYFQDFMTQTVAQKIDFSLATVQPVEKELRDAIKDAVDTVKTEDIQHVVDCNAAPIDEKQRDFIKNKSRVTRQESDKSKHFDFRTFLATTDLTERDAAFMLKRGKSKISAIERANSELDELHMQQAIDELENAPISLARLKINSTEFVRKLLDVVGLNNFENGKIQPSEKWHEWGGRININSPNVQQFLSWVWDNRSWINGLNISDLRSVKEGFNSDMQWLNTALSAVGVKMQSYEQVTVGKRRINKYCVDLENLTFLNEILARRFKQIHVMKLKSCNEVD